MDYGKFRYQQSKKQAKSGKQPTQKRKEIRLSPMTGDHDIETKLNQAKKFLEQHNKVFVRVRFRGRELQHIDEGRKVMLHLIEQLAELSKVEQPPRMEGKQMTALLAPKV